MSALWLCLVCFLFVSLHWLYGVTGGFWVDCGIVVVLSSYTIGGCTLLMSKVGFCWLSFVRFCFTVLMVWLVLEVSFRLGSLVSLTCCLWCLAVLRGLGLV